MNICIISIPIEIIAMSFIITNPIIDFDWVNFFGGVHIVVSHKFGFNTIPDSIKETLNFFFGC